MCASALVGAQVAGAAGEPPQESLLPAGSAPSTSGATERAGGGTGGHSIAIAYKGMQVPPPEGEGYTVRLGAPGKGGLGFDGLEELNDAPGKKESLLRFDEGHRAGCGA